MVTLLLGIIYLSFISLGLPDSLLGSAWPSMYGELGVSVSSAGIISMIIAGGTIISSLFSDRVIRRYRTGKVTAISVAMTAIALFGFSISHSFWSLCLWAIPYGLGAGSVDAALNNFVALHYKTRHMSWLHCFWGVGATAGPYIMGACLAAGKGWNAGYGAISYIQIALTIILLVSLPVWKKVDSDSDAGENQAHAMSMKQIVSIRGVKQALIGLCCYCALEMTTGLWGSTYLVMEKGISAGTAAKWASLFYIGITAGRFLAGFISIKLSDKNMVRLGQGVLALGILMLLLPLGKGILVVGFVTVGLGCAPIYPSIIHATPDNFGKELSQSIIGMQMASAYVGNTFMPPVFGLVAEYISVKWYPVYLLIFAVLMVVMMEKLNSIQKNK